MEKMIIGHTKDTLSQTNEQLFAKQVVIYLP